MTPEFAIIGHPNEGKSSVLSTLAEDDSVGISPVPGETKFCRAFPVVIDNKEVLRFIDTPGFQNPRLILATVKKKGISSLQGFQTFIATYGSNKDLRDDCELLKPIINGAGIIYVVDGSRPPRTIDKIEMEILRLTGLPRMAIVNCKDQDHAYLENWREEFRKNFNINRLFNAHHATYQERIELFEALKAIDQEMQPHLEKIILSFKQDWKRRNRQTIVHLSRMIKGCMDCSVSVPVDDHDNEKLVKEKLYQDYIKRVIQHEKKGHQHIRALYKHNIFNYNLPPHSILHHHLFGARTWEILGLSKKQVLITGGLSGATIGATIDLATAGLSFGIFTSLGTILGTLGAVVGGKKISGKRNFLGLPMGAEKYKLGPNNNLNFPFILLDRALIYYSHIINWAHGRRNYHHAVEDMSSEHAGHNQSIVSNLPQKSHKICTSYFKSLTKTSYMDNGQIEENFQELMESLLMEISTRKP